MLALIPTDVYRMFADDLQTLPSFLTPIATALGVILAAAAVIWTIAIAWRKFKEATNKV